VNQKKLFVGVPCYGGMLSCVTAHGLLELYVSLHASGVPSQTPYLVANESLVTRARNRIVAEFLKSDCSHLFFVDADIGFTPTDFQSLARGDFDVVGGAYPMKGINWRKIVELVKAGCPAEELATRSGFYATNPTTADLANGTISVIRKNGGRFAEVQDVPTGFLLIKRAALVSYIEHYADEIAYTADYAPNAGETHYDVFGVGLDPATSKEGRIRQLVRTLVDASRDGRDTRSIVDAIDRVTAEPATAVRYLSEDYYFSRRWQAMGGRTFVSLDCKLSHLGVYLFPGDVGAGLTALPFGPPPAG
jgi:hypothetical protein